MRLSGLEKTCLVIILVIVLLMVQPFGPSVYAGPEHLEEPVQVSLRVPDVRILETKEGPVTLQLVAEYRVEAGVRSRKNYRFDATAEVSPLDLVLAWGSLNQEEALDSVSYRQSGRWYYYRSEEDSPVSLSYVAKNSANTHIIPADAKVNKQLKRIRKNDYVRMEGYLVNVLFDAGPWKTSLSRTDTGAGACEIFYVESVVVY